MAGTKALTALVGQTLYDVGVAHGLCFLRNDCSRW